MIKDRNNILENGQITRAMDRHPSATQRHPDRHGRFVALYPDP